MASSSKNMVAWKAILVNSNLSAIRIDGVSREESLEVEWIEGVAGAGLFEWSVENDRG